MKIEYRTVRGGGYARQSAAGPKRRRPTRVNTLGRSRARDIPPFTTSSRNHGFTGGSRNPSARDSH